MKGLITYLMEFALGKKVLYAAATVVVGALRAALAAKYPDVILPTTEQIVALGIAMIGCHTATDIVYLVKDALAAYIQTKKLPEGLDNAE